MEPENEALEEEISIKNHHFQVPKKVYIIQDTKKQGNMLKSGVFKRSILPNWTITC